MNANIDWSSAEVNAWSRGFSYIDYTMIAAKMNVAPLDMLTKYEYMIQCSMLDMTMADGNKPFNLPELIDHINSLSGI